MSDVMAKDGDEADVTPEVPTGSAARPDSLPCPICETVLSGVQYGPDAPRVKCPSCGGVERHRAFAQAYREKFEGLEGLTGRRVRSTPCGRPAGPTSLGAGSGGLRAGGGGLRERGPRGARKSGTGVP